MKAARPAAENKFLIRAAIFFAAIFFGVGLVSAQTVETIIRVSGDASKPLTVEGRFSNPAAGRKNWSFARRYADVSGLEKRVGNLQLFAANGAPLAVKKLADGEFLSQEDAVSWRYALALALPHPGAAAHVSWVSGENGLLMLGDLLPQFGGEKLKGEIRFELPAGWRVSGGENQIGANEFILDNAANSVFLVGKDWREKTASVEGAIVNFVTAGDWQFSDDESLTMAGEILREHSKIFGAPPARRVRIFLLPFPQASAAEDWRAETRGANLILISGVVPYKSVALQRLHEQLRHELFHLWLPNAVKLRGSYDWFYEGFTVYQALKTGVALNRIRFQDFLDTLGQAFDLAKFGSRKLSLVEASNQRWNGTGNLIYAKGMIVAFLCDAALLRESGGRRSLTNIFRQIYDRHRAESGAAEANAAILKILNERAELRAIVERYIVGGDEIDWAETLNALGIEMKTVGGRTRLEIRGEPKGRRKDLLNELGYNQWRKLIPKRK